MQELKITIEGAVATGKSSLAYAIQKLCEENNIAVSIIGCEDEKPESINETLDKRLTSLSNKISVVVETKQLRRKSLGSV